MGGWVGGKEAYVCRWMGGWVEEKGFFFFFCWCWCCWYLPVVSPLACREASVSSTASFVKRMARFAVLRWVGWVCG